jgi:hypothetical protein
MTVVALTPDAPAVITSEEDLCAWVSQAGSGEAIEYHRGFLCIDRSGIDRFGAPIETLAMNQIAQRAYALAEAGFVHLVQRRIDVETFSYLVIARPQPEGAVPTAAELLSEEAA